MQPVGQVGARRLSRRQMLKWMGTLAAGATVAACAPAPAAPAAGAPAAAGPASVEITWLSHIYEPWNNALSAQAMQYMNLNPNVKIVYSYVLHADLNTKIVTSIASGTPPDIMGVYGPWMPQLVSNQWIDEAPDDVVQDLDANFPAVMKESATYDGKVYGYVQHIGIPIPIINEALYEADSVQPPTTYDELLAANQKLDKKDESGGWLQFGTTLSTSKGGSWNVIHFSAILFAHGGAFLNEDNTKSAFNSEAGLQAAQIYQQLAHPEAPSDAFVLQKSAMEWNGPWAKSNYAATAPDLRYKALLPLQGPKAQVTGSYVWFWVVSAAASAEKKQAAWKFLQWLSAPEQYEAQYRNVGLLPITKKLPAGLENDVWAQTFSKALEYAKIYYAKHPKWEQIDVAIGEEMERFAAREVTAEQFLETAAGKVDNILASA